MKKIRFLRKAWLCLCLVCPVLLSSCAVSHYLNTEDIRSQLKNWKLIITMAPGFDLNSLPVAVDNTEVSKSAFNPIETTPAIMKVAYIGTYQQMQQLMAESMAMDAVINVTLLDKNNRQTIFYDSESTK